MSTTSPLLRLTLQDLDENPDTWGTVLNVSALQLLEDGIAGAAQTDITSANQTLDTTVGGPSAADSARYMIVEVIGSPGLDTREVIVPTISKVYLIFNNTGDSSDVIVKTSAGTGPTIPEAQAQWVFCDGTNVVAASAATSVTAGTATTATDADALVGIAGANYAQKGVAQTFTAGQVSNRETISSTAGSLTVDCAVSNAFYMVTSEAFTMNAPSNATNGQQFTLAIQQGGGGPHAITWAASTFATAGGATITLSTVAGDVDYFGFEYMTGLAAPFSGSRWVVSQLKDLADL